MSEPRIALVTDANKGIGDAIAAGPGARWAGTSVSRPATGSTARKPSERRLPCLRLGTPTPTRR
jgi:hypothetical protein